MMNTSEARRQAEKDAIAKRRRQFRAAILVSMLVSGVALPTYVFIATTDDWGIYAAAFGLTVLVLHLLVLLGLRGLSKQQDFVIGDLEAQLAHSDAHWEKARNAAYSETDEKKSLQSRLDSLAIEYDMAVEANSRLRNEVVEKGRGHSTQLEQAMERFRNRSAELNASLKAANSRVAEVEQALEQTGADLAETRNDRDALAARVEALEAENVELAERAAEALATFKQREHWTPIAISDEDLARALAEPLR